MLRWLLIVALAIIAVIFLWRPAAAWWYLDAGNLAYMRGDRVTAAAYFVQGLRFEPDWRALLEDHGRAVLDDEPGVALADFKRADCGEPCTAEAGDAQSRLGHFDEAVNDYLASRAVERVGATVDRLAGEARFDDAIALERALASRLGTGMLAQADVASADFVIGGLDDRAAKATRDAAKTSAYRADAIRSFKHASQLAPFNEGYLLSLGFAESSWGDKRAARSAFQKVLDLHPHQSDAERGLAQLGVRNDDSN